MNFNQLFYYFDYKQNLFMPILLNSKVGYLHQIDEII